MVQYISSYILVGQIFERNINNVIMFTDNVITLYFKIISLNT